MFCPKCGAQVADGTKFCPSCGGDISGAAKPAGAGNAAAAVAADKGKMKTIAIAVVVLVVLIFIIAKVRGGSDTIDVSKYATIVFEGSNGSGYADVEFDSVKFAKKYTDKFQLSQKQIKKNLKNYLKAHKDDSDVEDLFAWYGDSVNEVVDALFEDMDMDVFEVDEDDVAELLEYMWYYAEFDQDTGLSNGDKVTLTWDFDEDYLMGFEMVYGVKIKGSDMTAKVKGLKK